MDLGKRGCEFAVALGRKIDERSAGETEVVAGGRRFPNHDAPQLSTFVAVDE
jgi:hypothetical protein